MVVSYLYPVYVVYSIYGNTPSGKGSCDSQTSAAVLLDIYIRIPRCWTSLIDNFSTRHKDLLLRTTRVTTGVRILTAPTNLPIEKYKKDSTSSMLFNTAFLKRLSQHISEDKS